MKKSLILNLLVIAFFHSYNCFSQIVNVQKLAKFPTEEGFGGEISGSFNIKSGNTQLISLNGKGNIRYKISRHVILFIFRGGFVKHKKETIQSKTFEHLRYRVNIYKLFEIESYLQHEYDEFRKLLIRGLWGIGPRITFISTKRFILGIGTSYMLEFIKTIPEEEKGIESREELYHRWSNYLTFSLKILNNLFFSSTSFLQPRFDKMSDVRLLTENSLRIVITKHFSIKLNYIVSYETKPVAPNVKKLDTSFGTELSFVF